MTRWQCRLPALLVLLASWPAEAYECSRVEDVDGKGSPGASLSWFTRDLRYSLHPGGTLDIIGRQELDILRDSFQVWEDLVATSGTPCPEDDEGTDLTIVEQPRADTDRYVGYNFLEPERNENLVLFWDTDWPHSALAHQVIGLTTVTYNALAGEILDADIEFNSEVFEFRADSMGHYDTDLMNTAVHEIGHYLGLGHESSNRSATMYPEAEPGETSKRDLDCDDTAAIVFKFPAGKPRGYCSPPTAACGMCAPPGKLAQAPKVVVTDKDDGRGGCSAARHPLGWLGLLSVALLLGSRSGLGPWRR